MTVVVALLDDDDTLVFGADSSASSDGSLTLRPDAKIFKKNGYTIGFAGSFRNFQLVQYSMILRAPPAFFSLDAAQKFMVTVFVPALRNCLSENGAMKLVNGIETMDGFILLVGFRSFLFTIEDDFHVAPHDEYAAIGSGCDVALGSLYASKEGGMFSAYEAAEVALYAAEHSCTEVRGPMYIV